MNQASQSELVLQHYGLEGLRAHIASLTPEAAEALLFDWDFFRRPAQAPPAWDWVTWLCLAGRGWGKTRVGAEQVREWAREVPIINLVGPTAADVRDVMIEGPSGILAICPRGERPLYQPSKARLVWPNGAVSLLFSAEEPERLRGPQCYKGWADELAAWQYLEDAWDQFMFGLRLGNNPQVVVTTTPKPVKIVKDLVKDKTTAITRGSTYDNRANLAKTFFNKIVTKYEGTRLGRQEINAELLDDNPNALFSRTIIDKNRVKREDVPPLARIVVAVDPAVTAKETSDDTGICVAGITPTFPPHIYILEDSTMEMAKPHEWASRVVVLYDKHQADRVVGEVNNGGDLVETNIRTARENISYRCVRATRGKILRAEPIAALHEQGRVHHVGSLAKMEDEMCEYDAVTVTKSPNRLDAQVWAVTELIDPAEEEAGTEHHEIVTINEDLDEAEFAIMNGYYSG